MTTTRHIRSYRMLGFAALAAVCLAGVSFAAEGTTAAFLGQKAPAFTLPDAAGQSHSLADLRGEKGTVLIWVSTECPVSNAYNERMAALAGKYEAKGYKFVGINSNKAESSADIQEHAKAHGLGFTILKDDANKIADEYGASVTPEAYVIDASGVLRYHGRIDDSMKMDGVTTHDLEEALGALVSGKEPAKPESKAFGCTIKRVG